MNGWNKFRRIRRGRGCALTLAGAALSFNLVLAPASPAAGSSSKGAATLPGKALDSKWNPSKLSYPPLSVLPQVKAERMALDNGFVVYIVRDAQLPDLQGNILIKAGSQYDPPEKVGLCGFTSQVLRTGGSTRVAGDSLDAYLESIGARIEVNSDVYAITAGFYCLKEHQTNVLRLLSEVLRDPAFPQGKLDLARMMARRGIAARNDEPGGLSRRLIRQLVWGKDHPFFRDTEFATIEGITVDDLKSFHQRYFVPNHMIMTIWGDFDPLEMRMELTRLFGDWASSDEPFPPAPVIPTADAGGGLFLAERPQMTQSYISLGQVGIKADIPDYPAMEVMGELLGGGFSSRIVNHIRTQRGLAYSAGAGAGVGWAFPGTFTAVALTRSDSTLVTLRLLQKELDQIVQEPPTEEEVRRARESLLNSFVFNFTSPGQVASKQAFYEFYGYPVDFLDTYQERLRAVTAADVQRVAKTYLRPERMRVLVVGTEATFAQPLSTVGEVTKVDLTIPGAPGGAGVGVSAGRGAGAK